MSHGHKHLYGFDELNRCRYASGSYTGDGNTDRLIRTLRFRPTWAVFHKRDSGPLYTTIFVCFWMGGNVGIKSHDGSSAGHVDCIDSFGGGHLITVYPNGGSNILNVNNSFYTYHVFGEMPYGETGDV